MDEKFFECLNPRCPNYVNVAGEIGHSEVYVGGKNLLHCRVCNSFVQTSMRTSIGMRTLTLTAASSFLVGFIVSGDLFGALLGLVFGIALAINQWPQQG